MTIPDRKRSLASLVSSCRGSTAIEFALVGGLVFVLVFGIIELGFTMWTRSTLQEVAAETARCVSIGSTACTSGASAYAVSLAGQWLPTNVITASDVAVSTSTSCYGASGKFTVVTISAPAWTGDLVSALGDTSQTLGACFPVS